MHALLLLLLILSTFCILLAIDKAKYDILKAIGERDKVTSATQQRAEKLQKAMDNLDAQVTDK